MSGSERDKWDERYRSGSYSGRTHPTALLAEWLGELPRGRALDVACGTGRNALHLAAAGFEVDALDISPVGLERGRQAAAARGLEVRWLEADLDGEPDAALPDGPYDLIVWVRYVNAALMAPLVRRLAPGGWLLCEQHLESSAAVVGPSSPQFRLRPNELLRSFLAAAVSADELVVRYYREGIVTDPDGRPAALAQLLGCRL